MAKRALISGQREVAASLNVNINPHDKIRCIGRISGVACAARSWPMLQLRYSLKRPGAMRLAATPLGGMSGVCIPLREVQEKGQRWRR
jgi:hypothetical protein